MLQCSASLNHRRRAADETSVAPSSDQQRPPSDALAAQLEARRRASEEDARALEDRRVAAANRALSGDETTDPTGEDPGAGAADPSHSDGPPTPPPPAAAPTAPPPPDVPVPTGGPATVVTHVLAAATAARRPPEVPVLEVRPAGIGADLDRTHPHLEVYPDRVEVRDRHGGLRRKLDLSDVEGVEVQRRLSGATLVVQSATGVDLVMKGLRPDDADAARQTILELRPPPGTRPPVDEARLLRHLVELHRAGLLDDAELTDKTARLAELAAEARRG